MGIVKVNGLKIHVQQLNSKAPETIILISGILGNVAQWYFTHAPLLAKKFHVVMFDMKSHGKSQKAKNGYDLQSLAGDVQGLMNALNIEKAHIAGYSFGAQIALKFGMIYPDRCLHLIVLESPSPKHNAIGQLMEGYEVANIGEIKQLLPNIMKEKMEDQIKKNKKMIGARFIIKSMLKIFTYLSRETTFIEDVMNEKEFKIDDLLMIKSNTLLLYGKESDCLDEANKLAKWIPSNEYVLKEDGEHWYPIENPEEVVAEIMNFFSRNKHDILKTV